MSLALDAPLPYGSPVCSMNSVALDSTIPHAYLTPSMEISRTLSVGYPVVYSKGGSYRCVAYSADVGQYVYSNKLYINNVLYNPVSGSSSS